MRAVPDAGPAPGEEAVVANGMLHRGHAAAPLIADPEDAIANAPIVNPATWLLRHIPQNIRVPDAVVKITHLR